MARVKLIEHRAKSLLVVDCQCVSITLGSLAEDLTKLDAKQKYIIKVDEGIKKRGKQGLIRLNVTKGGAKNALKELANKGFTKFIAEPMFAHEDSEERYLCIERVRGGTKVLYSEHGGVEVEAHSDEIQHYDDMTRVPLPQDFLSHIAKVMDQEHLSFVEMNPLVVRGDKCYLLDAAVLADSAGEHQAGWTSDDVVGIGHKSIAETEIAELNSNSSASFSFRVLNPDGAVWLLLSGGGASITIADEAANQGRADAIGNYGEYSGGPTQEETQVYTSAVLGQMNESQARRKTLVIAGGVANFTDVKKTFAGVIAAITENIESLKRSNALVYVRRGGPNEKEGLAMIEEFLRANGLLGSVHGSDEVLTRVINEALEYVDA